MPPVVSVHVGHYIALLYKLEDDTILDYNALGPGRRRAYRCRLPLTLGSEELPPNHTARHWRHQPDRRGWGFRLFGPC